MSRFKFRHLTQAQARKANAAISLCRVVRPNVIRGGIEEDLRQWHAANKGVDADHFIRVHRLITTLPKEVCQRIYDEYERVYSPTTPRTPEDVLEEIVFTTLAA